MSSSKEFFRVLSCPTPAGRDVGNLFLTPWELTMDAVRKGFLTAHQRASSYSRYAALSRSSNS